MMERHRRQARSLRWSAGAAALLVALDTSAPSDQAPAAGKEPPSLERIQSLLARRAALHSSLLYRFQCTEDISRSVQGRVSFPLVDEARKVLRHGIVVEKGPHGTARMTRLRLDDQGKVSLGADGAPVEEDLPADYEPAGSAVPQAQAAWFSREHLGRLTLALVGDSERDNGYRIPCERSREAAVEFLDPHPRRVEGACQGLTSGQMCVRLEDGEISRIVFYSLLADRRKCRWDRAAPFSFVEQEVAETGTGGRFPSRIRTFYSLDRSTHEIFEQTFRDCAFTNVRVQEKYGDVVTPEFPASGGGTPAPSPPR